jgi:hypothetical protein
MQASAALQIKQSLAQSECGLARFASGKSRHPVHNALHRNTRNRSATSG